jgi:imidazoleglycerol phosphate synthase glutamine amidotransferase subunit HisH
MTRMIDVIEYGGGNLGSVLRCLERLEVPYQTVNAQRLPSGDNPLLFPGVGAFGAAMMKLNQEGLSDCIRTLVRQGTPYLGICIGLQVLFERSEEAPGIAGLGLLPGEIKRFQSIPLSPSGSASQNEPGSPVNTTIQSDLIPKNSQSLPKSPVLKIPQIGWNWVEPLQSGWDGGFVYFVNSYYPQPEQADAILYQADYGKPFTAAVRRNNITAFQFHPEKSGPFGQALIARWLEHVR